MKQGSEEAGKMESDGIGKGGDPTELGCAAFVSFLTQFQRV